NKLNQEIFGRYDLPELIKEKEILLGQTLEKKEILHFWTILFGCLVIFVISLLYIYSYKKKQRKLKAILSSHKNEIKVLEENQIAEKNKAVSSLELSQELKEEILEKLNAFEINLEYLKNNLTLVKVSKKLKTNSTYLSKVINLEKQKNFTTYINDLRIDYCIEQIKSDKKFIRYSIKSMAREVGFNNIQSFAKAFSKKTGVNPAEFVKKMQEFDI
ncbi:helix-turn-helix domain-containing protein, partial [Aquimarina litoralis]|uniref:helix-turn-helix domain-containing protein n=1 Tax=Aquimarina litoralis TaxID=584605 RepID=UPI001C599AB1